MMLGESKGKRKKEEDKGLSREKAIVTTPRGLAR